MLASLVLASMAMTQDPTAVMVEQQYETRAVAYDQLVEGDYDAAIAELEEELADNPGDPAILINLGSAHAAAGNLERAEFYYTAARETDEHYELELADGRWIDSREAAALASATVEVEALAAR